MKQRIIFVRVLWVTAVILVLAACSSTEEVVSTATPLPATSLPPTATPLPTATAVAEAMAEEPQVVPTAVPILTFQIIPEESKALYQVEEEFLAGAVERLGKALGFNTAVAWTRTLEGEVQLMMDGSSVSVEGGQFTVDLTTLKSDDTKRDERIREQYLESNRFPIAEFVITGVEGFPTEYEMGEEITFMLVGDFTMREVTNEVMFEVTAVLQDDTLTGTAFTEIFMVDYGFDPPEIPGFIEALDPARVEVEFKAVKVSE